MKLLKLKIVLFSCIFICSFVCLGACKEAKKPKYEKVDYNGPEYTSKYICPMYCKGSGSSDKGICPVCKMDYELNEDYEKK